MESTAPLEPYPAPPLQAIDKEGFEYPPQPLPPAELFQSMLWYLRSKGQWTGFSGGGAKLPTAARRSLEPAEKDLASALECVEEAMRDLLIVADLMHVAREERSFIGQDSLTNAHLSIGTPQVPVSYIAPEVIFEMKKRSMSHAANDMTSWVKRMHETLQKGRRLTKTMAALRRTSRLQAGGLKAILTRPLSAGDPVSVLFDTKQGPVALPLKIDASGIPHVSGRAGVEAEQEETGVAPSQPPTSCLRVYLTDGAQGTSAECASWRPIDTGRVDGPGGLALSLQALEDEAYMGQVFESVRLEVAAPAQPWVDRNIFPERDAVGDESSSIDGRHKTYDGLARLRPVGSPYQVVEVSGEEVVVEVNPFHHLGIGFGSGLDGRPRLRPSRSDSLHRVCQLAFVRLIELTSRRGKPFEEHEVQEDEYPEGILARLTVEVSHLLFVDRLVMLLGELVRTVKDRTVPTTLESWRWVTFPFSAPESHFVILGRKEDCEAEAFLIDIRVTGTSVRVSYTFSRQGGKQNRTLSTDALSGLGDLKVYLERHLALRRPPSETSTK